MIEVAAIAFLVSFLATVAILKLAPRLLAKEFLERDLQARQAVHTRPAPRIGGLALAVSAVCTLALVLVLGPALDPTVAAVLGSAVPVFLAGLREDICRDMSPRARYGAAILSGFLAFGLLGVWIDRAAPDWFSALLAFAPFGVAVTVFTTASYAHAFNLVDGLNGLCAGMSVLIAAGLAAIAVRAGLPYLVPALLALVATLAGFLVWNYPMGRIFLGDAGAYTLGHVLSWCGVILIARADEVSAWAIMLVFFWPLADTLLAMVRRVQGGVPIDTPDRMHFHQLMMRFLVLAAMGRDRRSAANPVASLLVLGFIAVTVALGVIFWNDDRGAALSLGLCGVAFVALHGTLRRLARRWRRRPLGGARRPA
ncbi:MAG: UDP-phosphate N-acetylglucosaminyl 1-phosphate transferase [Alphaproteobacteria bacterium]|nr:MAG: UDP-phosphate N-acetylglucosaminyl 1-phosphate transferase [Alphaproteobacteria bacterium]